MNLINVGPTSQHVEFHFSITNHYVFSTCFIFVVEGKFSFKNEGE